MEELREILRETIELYSPYDDEVINIIDNLLYNKWNKWDGQIDHEEVEEDCYYTCYITELYYNSDIERYEIVFNEEYEEWNGEKWNEGGIPCRIYYNDNKFYWAIPAALSEHIDNIVFSYYGYFTE